MKTIILLLSLAFTMTSYATSPSENYQRSKGGGGGDPAEIEFHRIRTDIKEWILDGRAEKLDFQNRLSFSDYADSMLPLLEDHKVMFSFSKNTAETNVNGRPKICVNKAVQGLLSIVCNKIEFYLLSTQDKYQIVHHEFASLAEIEVYVNESSSYFLSSQISDYLTTKVVTKLSIDKNEKVSNYFKRHSDCKAPKKTALFSNMKTALRKALFDDISYIFKKNYNYQVQWHDVSIVNLDGVLNDYQSAYLVRPKVKVSTPSKNYYFEIVVRTKRDYSEDNLKRFKISSNYISKANKRDTYFLPSCGFKTNSDIEGLSIVNLETHYFYARSILIDKKLSYWVSE